MKVVALDHLVLNVKDVDKSLEFYGDVLGLQVLRLEQFRKGEVGFVSVRVSEDTLIDLSPGGRAEPGSENVDHFCLALDESDMDAVIEEFASRGVETPGPASPRWGARGRGPSFHVRDPDGNKIEIKSYQA